MHAHDTLRKQRRRRRGKKKSEGHWTSALGSLTPLEMGTLCLSISI